MTTEAWMTILAAAAAVLLGMAAVMGATGWLGRARHGGAVAAAVRAAAVVALAVSIGLAAAVGASPSLLDARLVAASLVLAGSGIHLALALAFRRPAGVWPVDALLAGLLGAVLLIMHSESTADCAQPVLPYSVEWALYLLGGGALLVAGGVGAAALAGRGRQSAAGSREAQEVLVAALQLALIAVGGGLLVGTWWAWQTTGRLLASDMRPVWMAVAWMVAGMALVTGELEVHTQRWGDALAVIAASAMIFGLFVLPDLLQLWGG